MDDPLLLRCLLVIVQMSLGHPASFRDGLLLEKELLAKLGERPEEPKTETAP